MLLSIKNLSVSIDAHFILSHFSLDIQPGSVHALLGPNGSGKSTLSQALMGYPGYTVQAEKCQFNNSNILELPVHKRARLGIFLSFQQPYTIPGMQVLRFLKESYTACTQNVIELTDFYDKAAAACRQVGLDESFLKRDVNDGFSGGEKKRLEVVHMLLLEPQLIILDEIDSGLDIDALRRIGETLQLYKKQKPDASILMITHYQNITKYLAPDYVHVLVAGKVVESGDAALLSQIEQYGYQSWV